jgi:hypothetical protein
VTFIKICSRRRKFSNSDGVEQKNILNLFLLKQLNLKSNHLTKNPPKDYLLGAARPDYLCPIGAEFRFGIIKHNFRTLRWLGIQLDQNSLAHEMRTRGNERVSVIKDMAMVVVTVHSMKQICSKQPGHAVHFEA